MQRTCYEIAQAQVKGLMRVQLLLEQFEPAQENSVRHGTHWNAIGSIPMKPTPPVTNTAFSPAILVLLDSKYRATMQANSATTTTARRRMTLKCMMTFNA